MSKLDVAQTILEQLGGNRFLAMTGARDLLGDARTLQFALPRSAHAKDGCNKVRVTLCDDDTYTVVFYKITNRGLQVQELAAQSMVYGASLRRVFTDHTGLNTHL